MWSAIRAQGQHFLVRVGANVTLLTRMNCVFQKGGRVLCWPGTTRQSQQFPLELRLVHVQVGKSGMWFLTSVLEARRLNHKQIVKLDAMHWGVEVDFRGLKQTRDRAKLRCRNDRRLLAEWNWSIMAMAVVELIALRGSLQPHAKTKTEAAVPIRDPQKRSLASTMRTLRDCLNHLASPPQAKCNLHSRLRQAVTDNYVRKVAKRSRCHRLNPDKKPLVDPRVRPLTPEEEKQLNTFKLRNAAAGKSFTALPCGARRAWDTGCGSVIRNRCPMYQRRLPSLICPSPSQLQRLVCMAWKQRQT